MKHSMALGLTFCLLLVICPPGLVCAATDTGEGACPMEAMRLASAETSCHEVGTLGTAAVPSEDPCCCSMKEQTPVPVPVMPEAASAASGGTEAPPVSVALALPPLAIQQGWRAHRTHPLPPKLDLFLQNSALLL